MHAVHCLMWDWLRKPWCWMLRFFNFNLLSFMSPMKWLNKDIYDWVWQNSHVSRSDFSPCMHTKVYMNKLLNSTFKTSHTWVAGYFSVTICRSSLGYKWRSGQPEDGCEWLYSSVVLNKDLYCKFPFSQFWDLNALWLGLMHPCLRYKWRSGQPGDGCEWLYSFVVLNKDLYCKFPFSQLCPLTWPNASLHLLSDCTAWYS